MASSSIKNEDSQRQYLSAMNQDYMDVVYTTATNAIVRHMSASLAPQITISGSCYQYDRSTPCGDAGAEVIAVAINGF